MRQYSANQPSLAFFTIAIMNLQAKKPLAKAARNPSTSARGPTPAPKEPLPVATFIKSRNCSPIMGMRTIRNENWAMPLRSTPTRSPVAMVLPLREMPGTTAMAWATPTVSACHQEMPLRAPATVGTLNFFPALSEIHSRAAVMHRPTPTCQSAPEKSPSTKSFRRNPTSITGISDTRILQI